eukprot:m.95117 g.95117  ORF g.95117 m.95117 type:complete len:954 (-) comp10088_c0_seq1:7-2868(-)
MHGMSSLLWLVGVAVSTVSVVSGNGATMHSGTIYVATQCHIFPGATLGQGSIDILDNVTDAGLCCDKCTANDKCAAWTWHVGTQECFLKDNVKTLQPPRPVDPNNKTMTGLREGPTCTPNAKPVDMCPQGYPCPNCGANVCSCEGPTGNTPNPFACRPPHDTFPFCDTSMPVHQRVLDLIGRINDTDKPNLLTARGHGGDGSALQALPALGVPAYYWGTNCLHSLNGGSCVEDSQGVTRCPTNFPSGPSFGATFNRDLIQSMANAIGIELRALFKNGSLGHPSLDCWGPVINLNRDPRWGRNGEGGTEDAYAMGELAAAWTRGFQAPRPSLLNANNTLLQGIITLKHMAVNSLENTAPFTRHSFDANSTYGVNNFVLADYYLRPFKSAIRDAGARGIMCSYNAVEGIPTCLSALMRNARSDWGFEGYVTSDSDSVANAYDAHNGHAYPQPTPDAQRAVALALTKGQCDINSGDTYYNYLINATEGGPAVAPYTVSMTDVDRALFNSLKQRFDLGLFDPEDAYEWPTNDDVGSDAHAALSLNASQESIVLLRNDHQLLPLATGKRIAVVGPHANAQEVLVQPYPFAPECPDHTFDCIVSPAEAISQLNGEEHTGAAPGCDLFFNSTANFSAAVALAQASDVVVLMLGIETCGMNPAHNLNPQRPGRCFQEKPTTEYVFPDPYLELEAHDRTIIDLPEIQHKFAAEILALGKPTVIVMINGGAVAFEAEAKFQGPAPVAIIEAFYPGLRGGEAIAQGIFGLHNKFGRLPYTIYPASFVNEADMSMHDLRHPPGRTYRYYRNPLFAFGTGLSLTDWSLSGDAPACLSSLATSTPDATCTVALELKNVGTRGGDAVIMAYFATPSTNDATAATPGLLTPLRQLFDFQRTTVESGGTTSVMFNVSVRALATYDADTGDLVARPGPITLSFDDGGGQVVNMTATVSGSPNTIEPFPSST